MWSRNLHMNILTCIWVVRNALIKGERLTRNRRGCSCWSWRTTSISCLHKYHQMDRCTTTTSKQLTSKRTRSFKHGRELCWVVIMQCWIFHYASFGRVTCKPMWDDQNSAQNPVIEMEEFTCSVGLEAPHLRILQVERNAKLVFPQFGHTQSPSEKPSGPAQESPEHCFQITSSSSVSQMLL